MIFTGRDESETDFRVDLVAEAHCSIRDDDIESTLGRQARR